MAKPVTQNSIVPPRRKSSLIRREKSNLSGHDALVVHPNRHLIVTTTRGVFTWGNNGVNEIFKSGSGGIVAARRAKNGSSLLAVADSQVVVLHDTRKGRQKSYKLRGSDGQLRLLRYAGDANHLFFTTTLQNAVQTYSLQESKLLDPSYHHPSPPTVFAISSNFNLLLSASVSPPTIHLTNLLLNTPPILLQPQCSASAVVTADFHPERPNVFLLAFADGACATYDAARLYRDSGRGERRTGPASSGATAETMSIKNIHIISNRVSATEVESGTEPHGFDVSTGITGIGDKSLGIAAAAFVPGFKRRFVTVGPDGKCCVIDHAGPGKKEACVVNSWYFRGPATSLSITPFQPDRGAFGKKDFQAPARVVPALQGNVIIAIGRQDGFALLFDLNGNQLGERSFHADGSRVIDVEWMNGEESSGMRPSKSGNTLPQTPSAKGKRKSVGSALARARLPTEKVVRAVDRTDAHVDIPTRNSSAKETRTADAINQHYLAVTALNHLDIFSPIKPLEPNSTAKKSSWKKAPTLDKSEAHIKAKRKNIVSHPADALSSQPPPIPLTRDISESSQATIKPKRRKSFSQSTNDAPARDELPPIPQRSATRIEDSGAATRARTALPDKGKFAETKAQLNGRNVVAGSSGPSRDLSLFVPYIEPNSIAVSPPAIEPKPEISSNKPIAQNAPPPEAVDEDLWTDISPLPLQPTRPAPRRTSAKRSRSQHKSVSFRSGTSELSNDTVIEWTAASARPPNPLLRRPPPDSPPKPSKIAKKGHITLSSSDVSEEDPPIQWSSFKAAPVFRIHNDLLHKRRERGTTSSHPSPMESREFPPPSIPLAETTHNLKLPKPSPPVPSSTKPPSTSCATKEDLAQFQVELTQHLHTVMQNDIQSLKDDMTRQFGLQKRWMEIKMVEWRELERRLEEENRGLRAQLATERRWKIR